MAELKKVMYKHIFFVRIRYVISSDTKLQLMVVHSNQKENDMLAAFVTLLKLGWIIIMMITNIKEDRW